MRRLLIAVLLMSCAGDDARHAPAPRAPEAVTAPPTPVVAAVAVDPRHAPAPRAPEAVTAPPTPVVAAVAVDPREAARRSAHDVLAEHCGECHESHRPTAKPAALAIFDLDQPDWPARFDDHRFESAARRLAGRSAAARDTFLAFRDAERAAPATPPGG